MRQTLDTTDEVQVVDDIDVEESGRSTGRFLDRPQLAAFEVAAEAGAAIAPRTLTVSSSTAHAQVDIKIVSFAAGGIVAAESVDPKVQALPLHSNVPEGMSPRIKQ